MKKNIIAIAAGLFTIIATLMASSACWWGMYQPTEPASLRDE